MIRFVAVVFVFGLLSAAQACAPNEANRSSTPVVAEVGPVVADHESTKTTLVALCGAQFETSLREIEAGSRREGLSRALQALSQCPVLSTDLRTIAQECAPLIAERRSVRLMAVLTEECAPKSPFDLASVLTKDCAPSEVSDALLRVVDAPTAAFTAQVERHLHAAQVPHRQRVLAHLLLGAAAEGEALGR